MKLDFIINLKEITTCISLLGVISSSSSSSVSNAYSDAARFAKFALLLTIFTSEEIQILNSKYL